MTLHSHLRMDGAWRVYAPGEPWRGRPAHLIRVVLRTLTTVAVGYHLHDLALVPTPRRRPSSVTSAPTCSARPTRSAAGIPTRRSGGCAPTPTATIAEALLDQRNLAGIGNLYKAEVLFLRGIHPGPRSSRWTIWRAWWRWRTAAAGQPGPLDPGHHRLAAAGRGDPMCTGAAVRRAAAAAR